MTCATENRAVLLSGWPVYRALQFPSPTFVFDHDFIFVADGDVERLHPWARQRWTWADGRYMQFDEYVKRITPEMIRRAYELAGGEQSDDLT